jgi:hypothetical protein
VNLVADTPVQLIGAGAAVVAAVFSVLAFLRMRQEGQAAEKRHRAQIQPRPLVEHSELLLNVQPPGSARVHIGISNPGGAATMWMALIQVGGYLFWRRAPVPAHYRSPPGGFEEVPSFSKRIPPTVGNTHEILASYALDVEENGWDVLEGKRTELPILEYLRERLTPLGFKVELTAQGTVSLSGL